MITEIGRLVESYHAWLRDKTVLRGLEGWVEITTPHLDRHNDYLQIYARRDDRGITLTDDGYTIADLEQSGCRLESGKRRDLLAMTLRGFGVHLHDDALEVRATPENFPVRKHNLVQAMLAVNDMFYLAVPMVTSLFMEDVAAWFDLNGVRYIQNVKLTGTSGFDFVFDFVVPKSRQLPERVVQLINRPSREQAQGAIMAWMDTRDARAPDARAYAFLNDAGGENPVAHSVADALRTYEIVPAVWSRREEFREELAA